MTKKSILSLLLAAAMLLSLAVCLPGAAFAESPEVDAQLELIYGQLPSLRQADGGLTWYYTVADLNHNGLLEFIAACQHPQDRSTNLKIWEVSSDGKSLTECRLDKDPDESFPDIITDSTDTYHDVSGDAWYYMFYDNVVLSDNDVFTSKSAYRLKDGVMAYMAYAVEHTQVENGVRNVSHTDANGIAISPEQYNAAGVNAFSTCERSNTSFDWFRMEDAGSLSRLADSFAVFTGRKAPTESFPVPKPEALTKPAAVQNAQATAAPAYTPTPTAAPAYTPTPTAAPAPVYLTVTKNPTNENKTEGQTALFVSCANAFESLNWTLVAPNGGEYSVQSFRNVFPRATVSGEYSTTLSISNVEKDMSNWGAYCTFYYQGQTARTSTAYIYVSEKQNKSAPSGTYAGSVTNWTYNTVTVKVEGKVEVTVPYGLCDIEGDLYYGAPASVLWDGANITYCYIRGDIPSPQPSYGSMSGTIYKDTAYTVYVVLQNGLGLHLNGGLVNIIGGNDIDGVSCTVYYTGYPSENTIYQIDAYGRDTYYDQGGWAGSQYYNNEYAYNQGGWAGSQYYNNEPTYHYDGEFAYDTGNYVPSVSDGYLPTHAYYNYDGSTYEAVWCPYCGAEVSLAMERCPVCGYFIQ